MSKLGCFHFMLIILSATKLCAQKEGQSRIDSLVSELSIKKEDSDKVSLLNDISFTYYGINPDIGINYGTQSLELARKIQWKSGIARANNVIGVNYLTKSDFPKALSFDLNSLKVYEELQDKKGMAGDFNDIGIIFAQQNNYSKALEYFSEALKMNQALGNKNWEASNLLNVGLIYFNLSDYEKALENTEKAKRIFGELKDKSAMANAIGNIGDIYIRQHDYSKGLEYHFNALNIGKELQDKYITASQLSSIGEAYLRIAKDSAKSQIKNHFAGNKFIVLKLAKAYTDSAIGAAKEIGNLNNLVLYYQQLSEIQTLLGDNKGALESYKNYAATKDSVFNAEKDKKLTQSAMQYEFDKKETTIQAQQEKKDIQQRNIRNSISAGLAATLVFLIVVYRQRNKIEKEKKRSDAEKQRNEELLLNILPAEVAQELKSTGTAKAKAYTMVTVMFTDFKDFTSTSEKVSAELLVEEIHYCFSAFDNIIQKHGIEKIKTIGDAYLCAGGLPVTNYTHAVDMVYAALEIRKFISERKKEKEDRGEIPFELRIGMHTGPVVAGIVGVRKYAYDIWGDTVNLAARMEQNSEAGKINISGNTYELVKTKFKCEYRGKIFAKNKGEIDMYFVED